MKISILVMALVLAASPALSAVPSLRGSAQALREQNLHADRENLSRLADKQELAKFKKAGLLVPLRNSKTLKVDSDLAAKYRWCRPQTLDFLNDFSSAFYEQFHKPIQVNSCVRTVEYQKNLRKRNGNAAPATGPLRSLHLTGTTVDITKLGFSPKEQQWMRDHLRKLKAKGRILTTEETRQAVMHIVVFKEPLRAKPAKPKVVANVPRPTPRPN